MATELKNNEAALVAQWDEATQEYFLTLALPSEEEFATTPLPDAFLLLTALFLKVHNDPEFAADIMDDLASNLDSGTGLTSTAEGDSLDDDEPTASSD